MAETVPIPEPPGLPLLGNLGEFTSSPTNDLLRLANTYGEIFRLHMGLRPAVFISTQALVNEVCDEKRFQKSVSSVLRVVREGAGDGLFTAHSNEPIWGKAHRVLTPAFGPLPIREMFDEMKDISSQLSLKWARHGPHAPIAVSDDFTKLALDTIALCSMDFRFNSYYQDKMHPFVQAMGDFLIESGRRNRRPGFAPNFLYRAANEKFYKDIAILKDTANAVVAARRKNPSDRKDLLGAMLSGVDPQTGEKLSDSNITDQLITFLIAGHETTSGMLSFAFYHLLKNPFAYRKVQEEVDAVLGRGPAKVEHVSKLPYINAVLRETLRLSAAIPAFTVEAIEDTLIGGKYLVHKGEPISCLLGKAHLDPTVYGEDATDFKPERMLDDNFARLNREFPNCWKPFGNGKRGCIGRGFAIQEAVLCMALLFQNFNFSFDDPNYQLEIASTLTIKPKDFYMRASLRHGMTPTELEHRLAGTGFSEDHHADKKTAGAASSKESQKPLAVYYGSNSGTCEALAQRVAADASSHGFRVTDLAPLDSANQNLPKDHPVVIVTASYEGQPPSNAAHFVSWIESLKGNELDGVSYAVFGCGHHDWVQTFHRIPKLVDSTLEQRGATRLVPLATTDAADRDMFSDFETWEDESLWPALKEKYGAGAVSIEGVGSGLIVDVSLPRKSTLRQDVEEAIVTDVRTLTESGSIKNHIEVQLPTGKTYRSGDYLAVLPFNPKGTISRVFRRFKLSWDAVLTIHSDQPTTLPTDTPISANDVLRAYVELSQPATKRNISVLIEAAQNEHLKAELEKLSGENYQQEIGAKRVSILDLLERFPSLELPFDSYLAMLPPMRVRQYSISSSPLADPSKLTLTYSVLEQPALSGQGSHFGVATHFLASLTPGERLHVAVRQSKAFHLPSDAENTPLIFVGTGSGLAPFRGFVQERAAMIAAGRKVAPALLFYGCRSPDMDDLYAAEFERWERLGAVEIRKAYSRASDKSLGCKYVQHRMTHDREDIYKLWDQGAKVLVCGSRDVGKAVEAVCVQLVKEKAEAQGKEVTEEQAQEWWDKQRNERYVTDVFD
ncbi:nadph cytochrome p450 [Trichoderma arundinaceum]|uniref:Bifunctional cytochrome P450/NADPH--P450 reductase n=1 Tax=Trichoderma arundinaceum TaxID=490622 RepID=A0A395NB36_TRIAR|nr:nadph cytochrome p450 [Trichoderma arundinaceum]